MQRLAKFKLKGYTIKPYKSKKKMGKGYRYGFSFSKTGENWSGLVLFAKDLEDAKRQLTQLLP